MKSSAFVFDVLFLSVVLYIVMLISLFFCSCDREK